MTNIFEVKTRLLWMPSNSMKLYNSIVINLIEVLCVIKKRLMWQTIWKLSMLPPITSVFFSLFWLMKTLWFFRSSYFLLESMNKIWRQIDHRIIIDLPLIRLIVVFQFQISFSQTNTFTSLWVVYACMRKRFATVDIILQIFGCTDKVWNKKITF